MTFLKNLVHQPLVLCGSHLLCSLRRKFRLAKRKPLPESSQPEFRFRFFDPRTIALPSNYRPQTKTHSGSSEKGIGWRALSEDEFVLTHKGFLPDEWTEELEMEWSAILRREWEAWSK